MSKIDPNILYLKAQMPEIEKLYDMVIDIRECYSLIKNANDDVVRSTLALNTFRGVLEIVKDVFSDKELNSEVITMAISAGSYITWGVLDPKDPDKHKPNAPGRAIK